MGVLGWDAVQEMRANPEVRYRHQGYEFRFRDGKLQFDNCAYWEDVQAWVMASDLADCDWERVAEPLTDVQLIEEWTRVADQCHLVSVNATYAEIMGRKDEMARTLRLCAAQLRERKLDVEVKP